MWNYPSSEFSVHANEILENYRIKLSMKKFTDSKECSKQQTQIRKPKANVTLVEYIISARTSREYNQEEIEIGINDLHYH